MGRHKIHKTKEQIMTAQKKWKEKHNEARRLKYANDEEYRRTVMLRNRREYRERTGSEPKPLLKALKHLSAYGMERRVVIGSKVRKLHTYRVRELADAMCHTHLLMIYRWMTKKVFPRANVLLDGAIEGQPGGYVYTTPQVRRIIEILAEHQKRTLHLRTDHTDTIEKLFKAVEKPL
jgi:hypothetical protein